MRKEDIQFEISEKAGTVNGILTEPPDAKALLLLAHGAGAGMQHKTMQLIADCLAEENIATLRFNFSYIEKGRKSPDSSKIAQETIRNVVLKANEFAKGLPLFAGGKSYGGRMTSSAAADEALPDVEGLIFFGFPLHPPGKPSADRAAHLHQVNLPMLFLQGTRDNLARMELIRQVTTDIKNAHLEVIEGADHSFHLKKSAGKSDEEVMRKIAGKVSSWMESHG